MMETRTKQVWSRGGARVAGRTVSRKFHPRKNLVGRAFQPIPTCAGGYANPGLRPQTSDLRIPTSPRFDQLRLNSANSDQIGVKKIKITVKRSARLHGKRFKFLINTVASARCREGARFLQPFQRLRVSRSEAVETAAGAFFRSFHRAKATVLMRGSKNNGFKCPWTPLVQALDFANDC
jgi:hypothetical protein